MHSGQIGSEEIGSRLAHLMRRIEQAAESRSAESEPNWSGYLSSHPLTAERIQPFEKGTN